MKYFLDTEFIETVGHIELISIGIVAEDGREYYAVHTEADLKNADQWVNDNVLAKMPEYNKGYHDLRKGGGSDEKYGKKSIVDIRKELHFWCGQENNVVEKCEFYGYFADYDWVVFCWIFGRMINLPKGFPMYCRDLKQMMDEKNNPTIKQHSNYPTQEKEHNALEDARWNKKLYEFLQTI
jgi:hypothetical protein